jgi:UDP-2-acetamido-2,6-beta-L-arabino-hexul-4-ose reductase
MNILITGSHGFIAKNLIVKLSEFKNYNILTLDKKSSKQDIHKKLIKADLIFHLAGVNKENYPNYSYDNNYTFTENICLILKKNLKKTKIIYASSTQAKLRNAYGKSKLKAEKILLNYKKKLEQMCHCIDFLMFLENGRNLIIILPLQLFVIKYITIKR